MPPRSHKTQPSPHRNAVRSRMEQDDGVACIAASIGTIAADVSAIQSLQLFRTSAAAVCLVRGHCRCKCPSPPIALTPRRHGRLERTQPFNCRSSQAPDAILRPDPRPESRPRPYTPRHPVTAMAPDACPAGSIGHKTHDKTTVIEQLFTPCSLLMCNKLPRGPDHGASGASDGIRMMAGSPGKRHPRSGCARSVMKGTGGRQAAPAFGLTLQGRRDKESRRRAARERRHPSGFASLVTVIGVTSGQAAGANGSRFPLSGSLPAILSVTGTPDPPLWLPHMPLPTG